MTHHQRFAFLLLILSHPVAAQVSLTQNFDSMGTSGTTPPSGWSFITWPTGDNTTWSSSIPDPSVSGGTTNATLSAVTDPSTQKSETNGYNFGLSTSSTNRCLGTSPTGSQGVALQWSVTNNGSQAVTTVQIGYDIRRFNAASSANELPGYWLFYSLDNGVSWNNVSTLNPTLSGPSGVIVPNSAGTTTVSATAFNLIYSWPVGSTMLLRWVDDNAAQTSPDQILGLDNVTLQSSAYVTGSAPTVSITSPSPSSTFTSPATINLAASASDSDGTISMVEFYQGATKIATDTTSPFSFSWTGVVDGSYSLTARATDNSGNITASPAVAITVNSPGSGILTRLPYLQNAGPTTMTIRWRSSQSIAGRVRFGTSAAALDTIVDEASATTDHEVTLTGLAADTKYYYSIGSALDTLAGGDANHFFVTSPTADSTPDTRIWVLGDAGTGTTNQTNVRDAFYSWTVSRDPNFVLQLGDNAYNSGTDSEFQTNQFDIYGALMKRVPFWSCLGNHETAQSTSFVNTYPYFSIYTFPKSAECGGIPSGTEHYYSFDYGNIHVISLDSMTADRSPTAAMATWLTNDLAATTKTWIICIFHHPPYTKGSHDSDTETPLIQMRTNILPILEAGGVDLVLCGHSHCYERSYLLDGHYGLSGTLASTMKKNSGDGRPAGNGAYIKPLTGPRDHFGAVYAVAGSSGQTSGGTLNHPAHFISLNQLGSLVLDVSGNRLDATFLRENSTIPDTFTIIKQGAADSDVDGIPDEYEINNGLNRFDPADALLDNDQDGLNNLAEYLFGLKPGTSDRFQWSSTYDKNTGQVTVSYPTLSGRTYQVLWSSDLASWQAGSGTVTGDGNTKDWVDDGSVTGTPPGSATKRFYQVKVTVPP